MTDLDGLKKALERPASVEEAWGRLDRDYYSRVELAVQSHYIGERVKPGESALVVGCVPGGYALGLLRRGNKAALAALSENYLKKAAEEISRQGLAGGLLAARQQAEVKLDAFGDGEFGHALLPGSLALLDAESERLLALREAARVVKPGGLIFLTLPSGLRCVQEMFYVPDLKYRLTALDSYAGRLDGLLKEGLGGAAAALRLIAGAGLRAELVYGADSAAGMAFDRIDEMAASGDGWRKLTDALIKLAPDPAIAGLSSNITYVLRKPA